VKTCKYLWFRRKANYLREHRQVLRNRAYNLYYKHKYKTAMWRVFRRLKNIFGDAERQPTSVEEVLALVKPQLESAMAVIERCAIQGPLHRNAALRRKEKMLKTIIAVCRRRNLLTVSQEDIKWKAPHKILGYTEPKICLLREPRPWQLPGWKSVHMLKKEYAKWYKKSGRGERQA